jgi:hypothetical protein
MKFVKDNFLSLIILFLVFILFFSKGKETTAPKVLKDTVWVYKDSIIYSKPQVIKTISILYKDRPKEYLPDTNYASLVLQYNKLVDKFLDSNIYQDSIKIDSIGHVYVKDTVSNNLLKGRSYSYSLKYPIINTYTTSPPKNQLYYGGGILGSPVELINNIQIGVILKTKKDRIVGINAGLNSQGTITYGVSSYWKIKLKK